MKKTKIMLARNRFRNGMFERSGSDFWLTPPDLLERLEYIYGDLFDPCPQNPTFDGLEIDWPLDHWIFVNPPYSNLSEWAKKCRIEHKKGCNIILLMPPRTCTKYWHYYINDHAHIIFLKGRLKFVNPVTHEASKPSPFPSILAIFRSDTWPITSIRGRHPKSSDFQKVTNPIEIISGELLR